MRKDVQIFVQAVADFLKLRRPVDLRIEDLWSWGLPVWGFSDKSTSTVFMHVFQLNWKDTARHEVCHLASKTKGHGKEWQRLMRRAKNV